MNYGIPYMGSKSKICEDVCKIFPSAENFYDLFGGGFSITHFMLLHRSKDFKQFHFNEIRSGMSDLIINAIAGKYSYDVFKPKWISREEFIDKKDSDLYIKLFWSFGNSGKCYLFGKDIEPYKKSMHNAIIFNEFDDIAIKTLGINSFKEGYTVKDRRFFLRSRISFLKNHKTDAERQQLQQLERLEQLERLQQLQQLEQLERLQQLEQLEQLERLELYSSSYIDVPIKENSVIYCDIPYEGTAEYDNNSKFNRTDFLNWADSNAQPVFISEYNISDKRFRCIQLKQKRSTLQNSTGSALIKSEKLYVNKAGYERLIKFNN